MISKNNKQDQHIPTYTKNISWAVFHIKTWFPWALKELCEARGIISMVRIERNNPSKREVSWNARMLWVTRNRQPKSECPETQSLCLSLLKLFCSFCFSVWKKWLRVEESIQPPVDPSEYGYEEHRTWRKPERVLIRVYPLLHRDTLASSARVSCDLVWTEKMLLS